MNIQIFVFATALAISPSTPDERFVSAFRALLESSEQKQDQPKPIGPCYSGYCPCDTNDPDYGGADIVLCKMIKRGHRPTNQELSAAEASREARRQLREFRQSRN
jgi:hypothetical protein